MTKQFILNRVIPAFFIIFVFASVAPAQEKSEDKSVVNENFRLNIQQKKIAETNYRADLQVSAATESKPPLAVKIGVGVQAENIVVTLKNVFGDVRFRGSLEKISNQINSYRKPPNNPQNQP